jgi:DNA-binding transcriptional LysR family regulator
MRDRARSGERQCRPIKSLHTKVDIGVDMDLHVLRVFRAVAVEGGVARAAEHLHCVQSNVSTRLAQLEENLGTLLFQRQGRKMVITPAGTKLLRYAERLLELAEEARDAVRAENSPTEMLRVGAITLAAATQLPPLLARYHCAYPMVRLDVKIGTSEKVISDVLTRKLDVGIVAGPVLDPALEVEELCREKMVLVTELSHSRVESLDDIGSKTVIVLRHGCPSPSLLEGWLAEREMAASKVLEVDRVEAVLNLVAAGIGVAVMPLSLLSQREVGCSVKCHELLSKCTDIPVSVVWHKDGLIYPARRAFIKVAKERRWPATTQG